MTNEDIDPLAPPSVELPDAPSVAPSEDVDEDSVYVKDSDKKEDAAAPVSVTIAQPIQDDEDTCNDDMFDDDNETLGSMSVMFAEARSSRKDPEGFAPPSHHMYDDSDAMTMTSMASVFSAKQKKNQGRRAGKRPSSTTRTTTHQNSGAPVHHQYGELQEPSTRSAHSCTNAAVGAPLDDDDEDDDNHTLGGLSGIIGGVNLMEEATSSEKGGGDEETGGDVMYECPLKADDTDGTANTDESSKKYFGVNASFFNRSRRGSNSRRRKTLAYCCTCSALVALICMSVTLGIRNHYNRQENNVPSPPGVPTAGETTRPPVAPGETVAPSDSPTIAPTATPTTNYIDPLMEFLQDSQVVFDKDPTLPQYMAVQWLAQEANDLEQPLRYDAKLLQRYAVLVLDFGLERGDGLVPPDSQTSAPNVVIDFNGTDIEYGYAVDEANETTTVTSTARNGGNVVNDDEDLPPYMTQTTIAIPGLDECEWEGISCGNGTNVEMVEKIDFKYSMLTGSIAPEIHLLRNSLKILDLAGNNIQGRIPEKLYDLNLLEELYLYQNDLTGTLSSKIGNWNNMTRLHLSHNRISGPIPQELKSPVAVRPLRYLNLYSNQLTGTIPEGLRLRNLLYLDLGRNNMQGTLPADLGETFVELRLLHLDHNAFVGSIPESYASVGNGRLWELSLDHNQLTGFVPDGHTTWNNMLTYNLHNNSLSGLGKKTCKLSVFEGGEMVEFTADCDICDCWMLCDRCNEAENDED